MSNWEKALLGTVLNDPGAWHTMEHLLPSDFTGPQQIAFAEIAALAGRNAIDARALTEALRSSPDFERFSDTGTPDEFVAELVFYRGAEPEEYVRRVLDAAIKRSLKRNAALIAAEADNDQKTAAEVVDFAESKLLNMRRNRDFEVRSFKDILTTFMPRVEGIRNGTFVPAWSPDVLAMRDVILFAEPTESICIAARPGSGKCLGAGTKVVMYDGTLKVVEDVQVGDLLIGPNSKPRLVLSLARGREMMYWVRQNHGIDYRVNESHILSLKRSKTECKHVHGDRLNISVRNLLQKPESFLGRYKGYKVPILLEEKAVPLEPYFLGLWLGDGTTTNSVVTSVDQEVIEYLQDYANRRGEYLHSHKLSHRISRPKKGNLSRDGVTIQSVLKRLGVIGNKHIPDLYLRNSRRVRMELLAGIIDSDGTMHSNGVEIIMQNEAMMRQIKWLADSLGFRTSAVRTKVATCQTGATSLAYRVSINGNFDMCPIRIQRKRPTPYAEGKHVDWKMTGIKIEQDKVDDYYGFTLDGDGLFLLEDMTVTHNSSYVRYEFFKAATNSKPVGIVNLENDENDYARGYLALATGIDSKKLKDPRLLSRWELEQVKEWAQRLANLPLYIKSMSSPSAAQVRTTIRRMVAEHRIELVAIDYLQLMNNAREKKNDDVSISSQQMRASAMELHIPHFDVSQMNRAVELRSDGAEPQLSDLRDSGSLEQDHTVIAFLHNQWSNPNQQQLRQFPENIAPDNSLFPRPKAVPIKFIVAKNRNGEAGPSETVKWIKSTGNFHTLVREQ